MGYPTLSHPIHGTIVLPRGHVFPHRFPTEFNQRRAIAENRLIARVAILGPPYEPLSGIHFELVPLATFMAVRAFIKAMPASADTFEFTDQDGTVYPKVRWWPPDGESIFDWIETTDGLYSGDLPLRIEA
jgi:hypothetical protein